MNYLAHGLESLHDPWELAGTALPDLIRSCERRARIPQEPRLEHLRETTPPGPPSESLRALLRGVRSHQEADRRFHGGPAFLALSAEFTAALRPVVPRASVVAHVLLELLLDAALAESEPGAIERYYRRLSELDPAELAAPARAWSARDLPRFESHFARFLELRFLADYSSDVRLLRWLGAVMGRARVDLPEHAVAPLLPRFRRVVRDQVEPLLEPVRGVEP